jgi:hypothetical protein
MHDYNSDACFGIQGLSPIAQSGCFLARSNSHSVAVRDGCTKIPLAAGGAHEDETILQSGCSSHPATRFVHLDPPELIRSWEIGEFGWRLSLPGFHHGSLNNDAGCDILPQCHQQFARQSHDGRFLETDPIVADPFLEPQRQRRLRLMA